MKKLATGISVAMMVLLLVLTSCSSPGTGDDGGGNEDEGARTLVWNLVPFADAGKAVTPDTDGGVFIGGESDKAFDPSYVPQGGADIFLARYDADLQRVWVVQKGSGLAEDVRALAGPLRRKREPAMGRRVRHRRRRRSHLACSRSR